MEVDFTPSDGRSADPTENAGNFLAGRVAPNAGGNEHRCSRQLELGLRSISLGVSHHQEPRGKDVLSGPGPTLN